MLIILALTNASPFPLFDIFISQLTGSPGDVFLIVAPGSVDIRGTYPGVIAIGKLTSGAKALDISMEIS